MQSSATPEKNLNGNQVFFILVVFCLWFLSLALTSWIVFDILGRETRGGLWAVENTTNATKMNWGEYCKAKRNGSVVLVVSKQDKFEFVIPDAQDPKEEDGVILPDENHVDDSEFTQQNIENDASNGTDFDFSEVGNNLTFLDLNFRTYVKLPLLPKPIADVICTDVLEPVQGLLVLAAICSASAFLSASFLFIKEKHKYSLLALVPATLVAVSAICGFAGLGRFNKTIDFTHLETGASHTLNIVASVIAILTSLSMFATILFPGLLAVDSGKGIKRRDAFKWVDIPVPVDVLTERTQQIMKKTAYDIEGFHYSDSLSV